ncbi:hypothetical protein EVAR_8900_1 [Eumeta japonica]|uniref:Uncharacterized protein n=1 Tax=Eumeta variegata TaxID=151549 RepID=A0A4C1U0I3_EUMVA|nr:hypothetical protein EVAR_8900_1 [Eumeta japonica]
MSNSPAPSCNSTNYQQVNSNPAPLINHSQHYRAMPVNQANLSTLKQDANSNNPHHISSVVTSPLTSLAPNVNYGPSLNSSPAFNSSTMTQPQPGSLQASPHRPPSSMPTSSSYQYTNNPQSVPFSSGNKINLPNSNIPLMTYGMNQGGYSNTMPPQQIRQINSNVPPYASSMSSAQPVVNGPPLIQQSSLQSQAIKTPPNSMVNVSNGSDGNQPISRQQGFVNNYVLTSGSIHAESSIKPINVPLSVGPSIRTYSGGPTGQIESTCSNNMAVSQSNSFMGSQSNVPLNAIQSGPQVSGSLSTPFHSISQSINPSPSTVYNTANINPLVNTSVRPPMNSPLMNSPPMTGPPMTGPPMTGPPMTGPPMTGPPMTGPPMTSPPMNLPAHTSPSIPMSNAMQQASNKPPVGVMSGPMRPMMPVGGPMNPQLNMSNSANFPNVGRSIENSALSSPLNNQPPVTTTLPNIQQTTRYPSSSQQQRYPTNMPPSPYVNHQPQQPQMANVSKQYPGQYNTQDITQRMGQLSVTKQGFDQLWGHQMMDLLQCKHVLPEYPEDPPEIKLGPHFTDAPNCSPE